MKKSGLQGKEEFDVDFTEEEYDSAVKEMVDIQDDSVDEKNHNDESKSEPKKTRRKKTEVEMLEIPGWQGPTSVKRKVKKRVYLQTVNPAPDVIADPAPEELLFTIHNIGYKISSVTRRGKRGWQIGRICFFALDSGDIDGIKPIILM